AWMECSLHEEYEQSEHVLIIGKVLRLEADDNALTPEGRLDVEKTRPLMMTGAENGMHFSTVTNMNRFASFEAVFPEALQGK
ncbi:MAG TPA: flavin reductase family protein, partial [Desulfosalsimonadaceae bacterium]|nr:flavin reductase family protein [Desulfosalsimonadaceae bacterium]